MNAMSQVYYGNLTIAITTNCYLQLVPRHSAYSAWQAKISFIELDTYSTRTM